MPSTKIESHAGISEEPIESKALVCDIIPGRRPRGKTALEFLAKKMEAA